MAKERRPRPETFYRPSWSRRVPAWGFLGLFVSLAVLTTVAVYFNNLEIMDLAGYFAGLASTVPLLVLVIAYYARPVWGLQVASEEAVVGRALRASVSSLGPVAVAERKGVLAPCSAVLRLDHPGCELGWYPVPSPRGGAHAAPRTVVLLVPRGADRAAFASLRDALRDVLVPARAAG